MSVKYKQIDHTENGGLRNYLLILGLKVMIFTVNIYIFPIFDCFFVYLARRISSTNNFQHNYKLGSIK